MAGRGLNQCRVAWNAWGDAARILNESCGQLCKYPDGTELRDPAALAWVAVKEASLTLLSASVELYKLLEKRHAERLAKPDARLSGSGSSERPYPICD